MGDEHISDEHYRRRGEDRLEGTATGSLYRLLVRAFLERPKMFMTAIVTVFLGTGGAVGTGVGAAYLPYVQHLEYEGHVALFEAHVARSDKAYRDLLRDNCESNKTAELRSLRQEVRQIKAEIWDLEGLGDARTQRETSRLVELRSDLDELQEELEDLRDVDCSEISPDATLRPIVIPAG